MTRSVRAAQAYRAVDLFNENEIALIRKEFTYNDARRYNRNAAHGAHETGGSFLEQDLDSSKNVILRNVSSKSVILAPFNTTITSLGKQELGGGADVFERNLVLRLGPRVREIDRK